MIHIVAVNVTLMWMIILSHAFILVKHCPVLVACAARYALKTSQAQVVTVFTPGFPDPKSFSADCSRVLQVEHDDYPFCHAQSSLWSSDVFEIG